MYCRIPPPRRKTDVEPRNGEIEGLTKRYKAVEAALADQVKALPKSIAMGVADITGMEIERLKSEREAIKKEIDVSHADTTEWIEQAIRSFELIHFAQEAILYGSPQIPASILNAIASNLTVNAENLICKLRSPFREAALSDERPEWWTILDSNQ